MIDDMPGRIWARNAPPDFVAEWANWEFEDTTGYVRADAAEAEITRLTAEVARKDAALSWYGENARLCRLIHSEGDAGRNALSFDGGAKARAALSPKTEGKTK